MTSIEERREVARRLRDVEKHVIPDARISDNPAIAEFIAAAVFYDLPYAQGLFARLADLIEPSEPKVRCVAEVKVDGEQLEKLAHDAAVELTGIDREGMLALADEMEQKADENRLTGMMSICRARSWADRIREALGVTDG